MENPIPRDPITLSDDDWGVQSLPKCKVFVEVGDSRDKDGCTPNVRVGPMVLIGRKYRDSWG